jgi:PII-like signaling protein
VPVTSPGKRLTLFLCERDTYEHRSLAVEVVRRAKAAGLAAAVMFRGIEGFGANRRVHTARLLTISEDLPLTVEIVGGSEAVDAFAAELKDLIVDQLAVVEDVQLVQRGTASRDE